MFCHRVSPELNLLTELLHSEANRNKIRKNIAMDDRITIVDAETKVRFSAKSSGRLERIQF